MSWTDFYRAILENHVQLVEEALFYIHTPAVEKDWKLEFAQTSLDIAAVLGHYNIVKTILQSTAFTSAMKKDEITEMKWGPLWRGMSMW
jgi:hypothetical protein